MVNTSKYALSQNWGNEIVCGYTHAPYTNILEFKKSKAHASRALLKRIILNNMKNKSLFLHTVQKRNWSLFDFKRLWSLYRLEDFKWIIGSIINWNTKKAPSKRNSTSQTSFKKDIASCKCSWSCCSTRFFWQSQDRTGGKAQVKINSKRDEEIADVACQHNMLVKLTQRPARSTCIKVWEGWDLTAKL